MRVWLTRLAPSCIGALALVWACSPAPVKRGLGSGSGSGGPNLGTGGSLVIEMPPDITCDPKLAGSPCSPDAPAPPGCGDGVLTEDEACDDSNRDNDDGCQGNCLAVDPGFSCNPPGEPCHELVVCGDSIVGTSEQCDDGNVDVGDGCSARCNFEIGYKCDGSPSVCTPTTCGDGAQEGAESCDDGNDRPFDGCSSVCQTEPSCTEGGCTSECGDGLSINEDCDDGNTKDGDGCSSACELEAGFLCSQDAECEKVNGECILRVPALFRDFNAKGAAGGHPDFQVTCGGEALQPGLVLADLSAAGKPQLNPAGPNACITSAATFAEWYTDSAKSQAIVGDVVLFSTAGGAFVNRWGPNGEQWASNPEYTVRWCGNGNTACTASPGAPNYFDGCNFAPATEQCFFPCTVPGGCGAACSCAGTVSGTTFDGNPFFFPVDASPAALTDARAEAKVGPTYGYPNWPWEKDIVPAAGTHNFHFTTEVKYWFQYDASTSATLDFTGDDDVWVYINGKLAVDLGGIHIPQSGSVTVNAAAAASYGLTDGNVYAISIFHAERKMEGSSFRLTLDGFNTARSECTPICGDGIVSLGEQCDDGINDGGYGECAAGCIIGAYCGDGVEQPGEDCDDGNRLDGDGCGSACRNVVVK